MLDEEAYFQCYQLLILQANCQFVPGYSKIWSSPNELVFALHFLVACYFLTMSFLSMDFNQAHSLINRNLWISKAIICQEKSTVKKIMFLRYFLFQSLVCVVL